MARLSSPSGVAHPHENDYTGAERQSARMSKITNDGLIQCGTGCFIAVSIWQQWHLFEYAPYK